MAGESWLVWRDSPEAGGGGVVLSNPESSMLYRPQGHMLEQPAQSPHQKEMFIKDWLIIRMAIDQTRSILTHLSQ